jgi:hypothetical protein
LRLLGNGQQARHQPVDIGQRFGADRLQPDRPAIVDR